MVKTKTTLASGEHVQDTFVLHLASTLDIILHLLHGWDFTCHISTMPSSEVS